MRRPLQHLAALLSAAMLWTGCGGGAETAADTDLSTLAYVATECREGPAGLRGHQRLVVQRGDREHVAMEVATLESLRVLGLCPLFGQSRMGFASPVAGAFQRLGVSPDGRTVVFEATAEFSVLPLRLPPEDEGLFAVDADGRNLRRLAAASREPSFGFLSNDIASVRNTDPFIAFSPSGETIAFTDRGPGPTGEISPQIFALHLETGERRQLTHLPPGPPPATFQEAGGTCCPRFDGEDAVIFASTADADGRHPDGHVVQYRVALDGSDLEAVFDVAAPGLAALPIQGVHGGADLGAVVRLLPEPPTNGFPPGPPAFEGVSEIFAAGADELTRLSDFARVDTLAPLRAASGERVYFVSSADPLGRNPTHSCQVFARVLGDRTLHQLTDFSEGDVPSVAGCFFNTRPGCAILFPFEEPASGTLLFYSSCDPLGGNPDGGQIFALAADGSLRQLTRARGSTRESDGTLLVELPGPFAYPVPPRDRRSAPARQGGRP